MVLFGFGFAFLSLIEGVLPNCAYNDSMIRGFSSAQAFNISSSIIIYSFSATNIKPTGW